jgi:glucan phosphoethanolaminetransferase (alkaline phosphatase superfamily)
MTKRIIHLLIGLLYIGVMILCIPIVIKPGAAIFYFKRTIDNQVIQPDEGSAYAYDLKVNPVIFRSQAILLYENGHLLDRADNNVMVSNGKSMYLLGQPYQGSVNILFSCSDQSNPIQNGRKYTLYIPLNIISRLNGILILVILSPGLAWFLFYMLTIPTQRRTLLESPRGILTVLDHFLEHIARITASEAGPLGQQIMDRADFWKRLFSVTILAAFFYIFMEWIFFVTMPSFMSILSLSEKMEVLILSGLAFSTLSMSVLAAYIGLDLIALAIHRSKITRHLGAIIPALILSGLALILIDNFTYTVFKFGISTSAGVSRAVYGLLFLILLIYLTIQLLKFLGLRGKEIKKKQSSNRLFYFALGILVISTGLAIARLDLVRPSSSDKMTGTQHAARHTSILLLGSDGLNAADMSVYGYKRDTTPRLLELAQASLVAENAFTNAGNSYGSITSILTGKLPTQTRVEFLPDILTGVNAFQHLPGILRDEGYKSFEFGVPYYVDANSFNMQNGFDVVNNRTQRQAKLWTLVRKLGYDNPAYFLDRVTERISARILHIFYIQEMVNPFTFVTQPVERVGDNEKIKQVLKLIDQSEEPLFIHVHLMGTHGPVFTPEERVFSKGEKQDQPWMVDFYDDATLNFDHYVGKVIDHLKATGQYENILLILYTDHNAADEINKRIPLIIHFPADEYAGRITQNVQNLDIAPTVLDYLGLPQPDWMGGKSLLKGRLDDNRLIFGTVTLGFTTNEFGGFILNPRLIKPPFYQFNTMNIIDCQKWYQVDLPTFSWTSGDVPGHTAPCTGGSLLSFDEIKQELIHRLVLDGFDTSSLH